MRSDANEASGQRHETDGNTLTTPPWLCTAMSSSDWAAVSGVSSAKFLPSRYIVFGSSSVSATMLRSVKNVRKSRACSGASITEHMDEAAAKL